MAESFRLLMLSAMYENGGNATQHFLDGHPELFAYPFESQPGTPFVVDRLSSLFPVKYRWPVFPLHGTPEEDYETIIDEECKVRLKTPHASKFRDYPIKLDDSQRKAAFVELMRDRPRTRGTLVEAFFRASADCWQDYCRSGRETIHVGYSPVIVVDADKIVRDLPGAHVLHVVRNPWSAYADTKKRAVPMSLADYMTAWCVCQQAALSFRSLHPGRVSLLRFEDIIANPERVLGKFLDTIGIGTAPALARPTWNGQPLGELKPWGTIRVPSPEANRATAAELSADEFREIAACAEPLARVLGYDPAAPSLRNAG